MARTPLAIVSSPRVGPTFSSWSGSGLRLAGRLPDLEDRDQVVDLLGLERPAPPSMIPGRGSPS